MSRDPKSQFAASKGLLALMLLASLATPQLARASDDDGGRVVNDGRMEGFNSNRDATIGQDFAKAASGYSIVNWVVFILCGVILTAVMFKDPKRSHLD